MGEVMWTLHFIIHIPLKNTVVKEIPGEPLPWSGREIVIY